MSETIGRLLAAGNVAEVFEWGSRVVKLYRSPARKNTAFREAANHSAVEAMALPVPAVWGVLDAAGAGGPPVEGDYDEGHGGGFDDERRPGGSGAPARAKTPVNDLDDDIPF